MLNLDIRQYSKKFTSVQISFGGISTESELLDKIDAGILYQHLQNICADLEYFIENVEY